ncbi:replication protein [Shewanella decolorationis]|uniref:replication protein n=1 Tax=Shewanella decolorationis TaxID=256839 RepID=UPI0010574552|nr:replication protein [Shewanella decolorationis]
MVLESIDSVNHGAGGSNVVPLRPVAEHKQQTRGGVVKADLDDGYLRLSNTLVDALCRTKLSDRESRVLFAVIRRTYGYGKATDWVSYSQIEEMTEIDTDNVSRVIRGLLKRNVLIKEGKKIGVNPTVSSWADKPTKAKTVNSDSENAPSILTVKPVYSDGEAVYSDSKTCLDRPPQKKDNITKDTIQKISSSHIADAMADMQVKPDAAIQTPNGKLWGSADDLTCAEFIYSRVLMVNPTAKKPNWPDWANQVRLMRMQDNRTHHEICKLFKFANTDSFWASNVLCPKTLRKQWDKLNAKLLARSSHEANTTTATANPSRYEHSTARVFRELREMAEQLEHSADHHGGGNTIDADYEPIQP